MKQIPRSGQPARGWRAGVAMVLGLAIAGFGIAACASSGPARGNTHRSNVNDVTMTPQQAAAYAEEILQDTINVLTPRPQLATSAADEAYGILNNTGPCTSGPNASQMVVVSRGYWLKGITGHDYGTIGEQVLAYWRRVHWVITGTANIGASQLQITAVAPPYAFSVSMSWGTAIGNPDGQLSIGASSVCLWPHGHPPSGQ
jgi:hypothetical protein